MADENNLIYNQFIEKLYNSPSSTPQDKERIVKLLLSERGKGFVTEERIREIIRKEVERVSGNGEKMNDNTNIGESTIQKKYIKPYYLSEFLIEYNQDPVLKYTCHNIDSKDVISDICHYCNTDSYDFNAHQRLILKHYEVLEKKYTIDYKIKGLIYTYLTGTDWKTHQPAKWVSLFEDSWGGTRIKKWALEHPNLVPNPGLNIKRQFRYEGCPLNKTYISPLTGERIVGFDGLVLFFKSLFHIKNDNSLGDIISVIEKSVKENHPRIVFERVDFQEETQLFTNVLNLKIAFEKIIRICLENGNGERISTSFFSAQDGDKLFIVKDNNSIYKKNIIDAVERPGESTNDVIEHQINGMCDLYLEADFPDGKSYLVNLWNGKERTATPLIEAVGGVKYIFDFKNRKR